MTNPIVEAALAAADAADAAAARPQAVPVPRVPFLATLPADGADYEPRHLFAHKRVAGSAAIEFVELPVDAASPLDVTRMFAALLAEGYIGTLDAAGQFTPLDPALLPPEVVVLSPARPVPVADAASDDGVSGLVLP